MLLPASAALSVLLIVVISGVGLSSFCSSLSGNLADGNRKGNGGLRKEKESFYFSHVKVITDYGLSRLEIELLFIMFLFLEPTSVFIEVRRPGSLPGVMEL